MGSNPASPTNRPLSLAAGVCLPPPEMPGCAGQATTSVSAMELRDFQRLMDDLYGDADRQRGVPATVAWLCEELGELAQAVRKGTIDQQRHELGDVLAWLASLANQLDLSLDDAAQRFVDNPPPLSGA